MSTSKKADQELQVTVGGRKGESADLHTLPFSFSSPPPTAPRAGRVPAYFINVAGAGSRKDGLISSTGLIEDSTFEAQKSPLSRGEPTIEPVSPRSPPLAPLPISLIKGTIGLSSRSPNPPSHPHARPPEPHQSLLQRLEHIPHHRKGRGGAGEPGSLCQHDLACTARPAVPIGNTQHFKPHSGSSNHPLTAPLLLPCLAPPWTDACSRLLACLSQVVSLRVFTSRRSSWAFLNGQSALCTDPQPFRGLHVRKGFRASRRLCLGGAFCCVPMPPFGPVSDPCQLFFVATSYVLLALSLIVMWVGGISVSDV